MAQVDLSDAQVDAMWHAIVENYNPDRGKASAAWEELGQRYRSLGVRLSKR